MTRSPISAGANITLGGSAEAGTTSNQERSLREIKLPSWTTAEFSCGASRWFFLINSANAPAVFTISGWSRGCQAEDAFNGEAIGVKADSPLRQELPAYGVIAIHWTICKVGQAAE